MAIGKSQHDGGLVRELSKGKPIQTSNSLIHSLIDGYDLDHV